MEQLTKEQPNTNLRSFLCLDDQYESFDEKDKATVSNKYSNILSTLNKTDDFPREDVIIDQELLRDTDRFAGRSTNNSVIYAEVKKRKKAEEETIRIVTAIRSATVILLSRATNQKQVDNITLRKSASMYPSNRPKKIFDDKLDDKENTARIKKFNNEYQIMLNEYDIIDISVEPPHNLRQIQIETTIRRMEGSQLDK